MPRVRPIAAHPVPSPLDGPGARFLTYTPWTGQLNNTRMCFEVALILAVLTRRILVVSPLYRRLGQAVDGFLPLHPAEFLDFGMAARLNPIVPHRDYLAWQSRHGTAERIDLRFDPGAAVFCHPRQPFAGSADAARLDAFACGRACRIELTSAQERCTCLNLSEPLLENFATFFFGPPALTLACARWIRHHIRFRPEIIHLGEWIAACLGSYNAVHLRRTDFLDHYPDAVPPLATVLERLLAEFPVGFRLYIASDERDRSRFDDIASRYAVTMLEDLLPSPPLAPELVACAEQVACSRALAFMGSRLSTFSAYICRLRGYAGAADQRLRYADDVQDASHAQSKWAPFSWCVQGDAADPLWAREFREAWM